MFMTEVDLDRALVVRPFRVADQAEVRSLILAGLEDRWSQLDDSLNGDLDDIATTYGKGLTLTAWFSNRLVGTGTLMPRDGHDAEVLRMSTASNYRGRGIATRLLGDLLAEARRRGVRTVVVETTADWADARALYERNGFILDREEDGEFCRDAFYFLHLGVADVGGEVPESKLR